MIKLVTRSDLLTFHFFKELIYSIVHGFSSSIFESNYAFGINDVIVGQPLTAQAVAIGPPVLPPSQNEGQVILFSSIAFLYLLEESLLTPRIVKGLSFNLSTSDRS